MNKITNNKPKILAGALVVFFGVVALGILGSSQHLPSVRSFLGATALSQPSITGLTTANLDPWSVEINWDTPGFPSDSLVYYGTSPNTLSSQATKRCGTDTGGLVTSHCVYIGSLAQNAMYYYKARSSNGSSVAISDSPLSFTVPPLTVDNAGFEKVPPSTPLGVNAQTVSPTSAIISWQPALDNSGMPVTYKLFRDNAVVAAITTTSFTDSGLTQGTLYTYKVRAVDPSGNESSDSSLTSVTTPTISVSDSSIVPPTPASFAAVYNTVGTVSFTWADTPNEYSYRIYMRMQGTSDWTTKVAEYGKDTTAASTLAPASGKYEYMIEACNGVGCSAASGIASVSINVCESADCDAIPPTKPMNLHTTFLGSSHIDLAWNSSIDDVSVAKYSLYRSGSFVADVTGTTTYTDSVIASGISYLYYVIAVDEAGHASDPSSPLSVTVPYYDPAPPAPAPEPATSASNSLTGTAETPVNTPTAKTVASSFVPFTSKLARGSTGTEVKQLQDFLIDKGDLSEGSNTGYFGALTEAGLKKYQCAKGIVCSGTPTSTGYGAFGPTTRKYINADQAIK